MTTRIGRRGLGALLGCLLLAGCLPMPGAAPRGQSVLGGAVRIAAPGGYCIDPAAGLQAADTALVLIGRCTGGPGTLRAPAILTIAVGRQGTGFEVATSGDELTAFFSSDQGRAALSHTGRAKTVTLLETLVVREAFLMRLRDSSPNPDSPGQAESWRAVLAVAGRLVTLTVTGTTRSPLSRDAGRALLDRFVAAMQAANRGPTR